MKYPKVIIVDPEKTYIYLKNFLEWANENPKIQKNFSTLPFQELTKGMSAITETFSELWGTVESEVMTSISKISGFDWDIEKTPAIFVYPIPFFNSFSHPLFLKICDVKDGVIMSRSQGLIMGMLIHEIIHNNMKGLGLGRQLNESIINFIVLKILSVVSTSYKKEYEDFHTKIGKLLDNSLVPEKIINGEISVREYYK